MTKVKLRRSSRLARVALLSIAAFLALLGTRSGHTQGTEPTGAVGLSEEMQLEGPARVVVRDLPPAAQTPGHTGNAVPRPRSSPQSSLATQNAAPGANARDASAPSQLPSAPALSGSG
ncbi:MAG: hypothetical protein E6I03_12720 [Chloroflexi bacterium]|nr:MAG: hypothetical protein E6I03_12720 [Chloroflexota bacterium]